MRRVKMCQANFLSFFFGSTLENRPAEKRLIHNSFGRGSRKPAVESIPMDAPLG
jgi:hypothetical protein